MENDILMKVFVVLGGLAVISYTFQFTVFYRILFKQKKNGKGRWRTNSNDPAPGRKGVRKNGIMKNPRTC
jgi:hypothetical protein